MLPRICRLLCLSDQNGLRLVAARFQPQTVRGESWSEECPKALEHVSYGSLQKGDERGLTPVALIAIVLAIGMRQHHRVSCQ